MIDKVTPYKDHGIWLEVGFGNASLLFTAAEYGFTSIGIDLREENVQKLKSYGVAAYTIDIVDVASDSPMSVISMADVLEHIPFPKKALQRAYELLEDKGVLLLFLPNTETVIWQLRNQQNINFIGARWNIITTSLDPDYIDY